MSLRILCLFVLGVATGVFYLARKELALGVSTVYTYFVLPIFVIFSSIAVSSNFMAKYDVF